MDLKYDPAHEEREWFVQRVCWGLMALAVIAALVGFLGSGPISRKTSGGETLRVKYQRFGRYQAPAELKIYCRPEAGERFELSFDRAFIESSEIEEISPEPEKTRSEGDRYVYMFQKGEGGEHLVTFRIKGERFGKQTAKVMLNGTQSVNIQTFYWP